MQTAIKQFLDNIKSTKELDTLYHHLKDNLMLPNDLSDLLRAQIVYGVSALDKLVHELIRIGMLDIFDGKRAKTATYEGFAISAKTLEKIKTAIVERAKNPNVPPQSNEEIPAYWFEQQIILKNKMESFQEAEKIKRGLSLIWKEEYKWQKIAGLMQMSEKNVQTILNMIVDRRNQIVHEADVDIRTGLKAIIDPDDTKEMLDFIEKLGLAIFNCVK
jgi:RiboL-PSP-HEPN